MPERNYKLWHFYCTSTAE